MMFACFLPISASTRHSDHHNVSGRYMYGDLKSENINAEEVPNWQSHHTAWSLNCHIRYHYVPERYSSKTLTGLLFIIEWNSLTNYQVPQLNYKHPQDQRHSPIAVHSWMQYPMISTTPWDEQEHLRLLCFLAFRVIASAANARNGQPTPSKTLPGLMIYHKPLSAASVKKCLF